jgi:hypothetical protein
MRVGLEFRLPVLFLFLLMSPADVMLPRQCHTRMTARVPGRSRRALDGHPRRTNHYALNADAAGIASNWTSSEYLGAAPGIGRNA